MINISKQNIILLFVLIFLGTLAYTIYKKNHEAARQLVKADRGFTVEDISHVTKVVVKHVKLPATIFTNSERKWIINGKYPADPAVMINIEKVLTNVRMLFVPPQNSTPTILKSIRENGIQVDIYLKNDKIPDRIIHIGSDTQDGDGTYMVLGGSGQPYAMHLPGLSGGLRSRFEQTLDNYRDKFIFQVSTDQIASLEVKYHKDNRHSFCIYNSERQLTLKPLMPRNGEHFYQNDKTLQSYLSLFESLGAEKLMNHDPVKTKLPDMVPAATVNVIKKDKTTDRYDFYPYHDGENDFGPATSPGEIRFYNRLYVLVNNLDLYVVQNRVFGHVFRSFEDFNSKVQSAK